MRLAGKALAYPSPYRRRFRLSIPPWSQPAASSLGDVDYLQAVRGTLPIILMAVLAFGVSTYLPEISMRLPRAIYPGL